MTVVSQECFCQGNCKWHVEFKVIKSSVMFMVFSITLYKMSCAFCYCRANGEGLNVSSWLIKAQSIVMCRLACCVLYHYMKIKTNNVWWYLIINRFFWMFLPKRVDTIRRPFLLRRDFPETRIMLVKISTLCAYSNEHLLISCLLQSPQVALLSNLAKLSYWLKALGRSTDRFGSRAYWILYDYELGQIR